MIDQRGEPPSEVTPRQPSVQEGHYENEGPELGHNAWAVGNILFFVAFGVVFAVPIAIRLLYVDLPGGDKKDRAHRLACVYLVLVPTALAGAIVASLLAGASWEDGEIRGPVAVVCVFMFAVCIIGLFTVRPARWQNGAE